MLLHVYDLKTYFHTKTGPARAVDGVSFDIEAGETFCLVGESGCGKSLTALSIMQLVPQPPGYYAGGAVLYKGRDLMRLPETEKRRLRGREIAMIFQEPMTSLNPVLTVGYQLMEPLRHHQRLSEAAARAKALDLLAQVYIPDPAQRFAAYPHQLSGGMKQRVMIAMALACEPGLLIAAAMLMLQVGLTAQDTTLSADERLVYLCVIMGITSWTELCRLLRGEVLKLREIEYIQAADAFGVTRLTIMLRHLVPNVMHIVLISVILRFSGLVLAEAVLAYVGIGVDPSMQSWGNMINQARLELARDPIVWWNLCAALVFTLGLVLPANVFGDAVRDALDPRLRTR
jgi:ABC-type dipeptide/oligopeptide/nickel transport system ATPase subunit